MSGSLAIGIALTMLAGLMSGNCMLPIKFTRSWRWEGTWLIFSIVSLVILPWMLAIILVGNLFETYHFLSVRQLLIPALLGAGWGIAQILFGISVKRLGLGLAYAIIVGLGAALGTLVPLFVQHHGQAKGHVMLFNTFLYFKGLKGLTQHACWRSILGGVSMSFPEEFRGLRAWRKLCLFAISGLLCIGGLPSSYAQLGTASINGTVRDPAGAVIPDADLNLHSLNTGVDSSTVTNAAGAYAILHILPGTYSLSARKQGFNAVEENNIILSVDQTTTFDLTLPIGVVSQQVTVSASGGALETSTAGLGVVISSRQVQDLPLNGRNFSQLLALTPGVSPVNTSQSKAGSDISTIGTFAFSSVNGQYNRANMFLLDGLNDLEAVRNEYSVPPILDDILEFKVDSHNDLAEFGGTLGGTINVVTKRGSNQFHGTAWEYVRNSEFDAKNPLTGLSALHQHQFGGNVGGPIWRNRTFFFGSYQGYRHTGAGSRFYVVPTSAQLAGDFSSTGAQLYNPFTTVPDPLNPGVYTRTPFANNNIASALDPNMVAIAKAIFPAPVTTRLSSFNGIDTTANIVDSDQYNIRVDEQFTSRDSLWGRFMHIDTPASGSGGFVGALANTQFDAHVIGVDWTHVFRPAVVMQIQFGRNDARDVQANLIQHQDAQTFVQAHNISPLFACGLQHSPSGPCIIPTFSISGYLSGGGNYVNRHLSSIWELRGNVSVLRGKHLFSAGTDLNTNDFDEPIGVIQEGFQASQTQNLKSPGGTGNALASFLLGLPASASRRALVETEQKGGEGAVYVQDQWKATDRLTINVGIRYDLTRKPIYGRSRYGNQYVGDMDLTNGTYILAQQPTACSSTQNAPCIPGGALPANVVLTPYSNGRVLSNNDNNIQPRLGLAFRADPNTVVHASFGSVFDNWGGIAQQAQTYAGTWPSITQISANNINSNIPAIMAENPLAQANALPAVTPFLQVAFFVDPKIRSPYSEQWTFGIQHQIQSTVFMANYVGSHDVHLDLGEYGNTAVTPGPGNAATVASRRPFPYITPTNYETDRGQSNYDALELSLNRRSTKGLDFLIAYTWSKSIDLGCSGFFGLEGCAIQNPYNLQADSSVSSFDLTNIFNASLNYQLPFGRGQRFNTGNRALDYVIGGWAVNGIATVTSGTPYYTCISGDLANTGNNGNGSPGNCYLRLNVVGNPKLSHPTISQWFNKAAFAVPALYTFGSESRNFLRSDSYKNLDLSIFRNFPLWGDTGIQFRAEAFNVTNTVIWGIPDGNYNDGNRFSTVSSTANQPRQLQFALRFSF